MTAVSPVGVEVLTVFVDGEHVVLVDHLHRTWWKGSRSELASDIPVLTLLADTPPASLSRLLLALPVEPRRLDVCADMRQCLTDGVFRYTIGADGVSAADSLGTPDAALHVEYDSSFPPSRATFTLPGRGLRVEVQHLDLESAEKGPTRPSPGPEYRCCSLPAALTPEQ